MKVQLTELFYFKSLLYLCVALYSHFKLTDGGYMKNYVLLMSILIGFFAISFADGNTRANECTLSNNRPDFEISLTTENKTLIIKENSVCKEITFVQNAYEWKSFLYAVKSKQFNYLEKQAAGWKEMQANCNSVNNSEIEKCRYLSKDITSLLTLSLQTINSNQSQYQNKVQKIRSLILELQQTP